jgi:alkylation response protein AidB-like acyl-CoA dehydrogenase
MTQLGEHHFESFLAALSEDWYEDDPLLHRLLQEHAPGVDRAPLARWGRAVAGPLRRLAEESARPENAPLLRHHDAHDRRVDEVVLPGSTTQALAIVAGDAVLGAVRGDPFVHYAMVYLLAQNGEAGVACSVACTDGLVRALDALGDGDPHRLALAAVRDSSRESYAHAAQFVTEIQGGSDVPANVLRAVPAGDGFTLQGRKWFCSNINADWFLVTARPEYPPGPAEHVGLFLVPAYGEDGARNGYTVDRLKDKLGTRELATAEVTFEGARAWAVGAPERGVPNLLRYVLTPSRFACVIFAAAALRQAERIAGEYARFRHAFGRPIADYPLVARTLDRIAAARGRCLTCIFELLRLWRAAEDGGNRSDDAVQFRILLSLAKPVWTREATTLLHDAMMLLGGNGVEERFSPLPRLYRDSVIMETWEGPHNVLYTQALTDLVRFDVDPATFVERVTGGPSPELVEAMSLAMSAARRGQDGTVALADLAPRLLGVTPPADGPGPRHRMNGA